jgi:hypothetical protein
MHIVGTKRAYPLKNGGAKPPIYGNIFPMMAGQPGDYHEQQFFEIEVWRDADLSVGFYSHIF